MENINSNLTVQQLVSFSMGNEVFGVDILKVKEIIRVSGITPLPDTSDYLEGLINLRGQLIPVISLRCKLGLSKKDKTKDSRIIVVEINNSTIGFLVDKVNEVLRISNDLIDIPPQLTINVNTNYITSIARLADRILILLDLNKITIEDDLKEIAA